MKTHKGYFWSVFVGACMLVGAPCICTTSLAAIEVGRNCNAVSQGTSLEGCQATYEELSKHRGLFGYPKIADWTKELRLGRFVTGAVAGEEKTDLFEDSRHTPGLRLIHFSLDTHSNELTFSYADRGVPYEGSIYSCLPVKSDMTKRSMLCRLSQFIHARRTPTQEEKAKHIIELSLVGNSNDYTVHVKSVTSDGVVVQDIKPDLPKVGGTFAGQADGLAGRARALNAAYGDCMTYIKEHGDLKHAAAFDGKTAACSKEESDCTNEKDTKYIPIIPFLIYSYELRAWIPDTVGISHTQSTWICHSRVILK